MNISKVKSIKCTVQMKNGTKRVIEVESEPFKATCIKQELIKEKEKQ